eukprot:gene14574-31020_t
MIDADGNSVFLELICNTNDRSHIILSTISLCLFVMFMSIDLLEVVTSKKKDARVSMTAPVGRPYPAFSDGGGLERAGKRIPATQSGGTVTRRANSVPVRRIAASSEGLAPAVVGAGIMGVRGLKGLR